MMFKVPKNLRRTKFDRLLSLELNDFDVERLLPTLFNLVVTRGSNRTSGNNENKSVAEFVTGLANNPAMTGFSSPDGQQLLDQWVRAVCLKTGQAGRGKTREKIEFVSPHTLLTYKTGLPKPSSRQRNVPRFLYTEMCDAIAEGSPNERRLNLQQWLKEVFGAGLEMTDSPPYEGRYDGQTSVDIHTLLTLHLLSEFDTGAITRYDLKDPPPLLENQATQVGQNILLLIRGYRNLLPVSFISRMLMAIINLDLLTYTFRLMASVNSICCNGKIHDTESSEAFPEIYLDATGDRRSQSDSIARSCVERDLETTGRFFENSLRLFTLDRMRDFSDTLQQQIPDDSDTTLAEYLCRLLDAESSVEVRVRAEAELEQILQESNADTTSTAEKEALKHNLQSRVKRKSAISVLNEILCENLRRKGVQSSAQWFRGVGGLNRSYGVLLGNVRGPRNWRYVLTDELLRTLVYLNAVDRYRDNVNDAIPSASIRLDEFMAWLRKRFGIVIDRPPREFTSTSSRLAAAENFNAFKRRLRQTGFFRGLSDDFNVQSLTVSLANHSEDEVSV